MQKNINSLRFINVLVSLALLITLIATTAGWYQPSTETPAGEQTARFLPENTNAYFSFNLQPGYSQSYQLAYFLSFFKADFLAAVHDSDPDYGPLAADLLNDRNFASIVGPELAMATFNYNGSDGFVFFIQIPTAGNAVEIRDAIIALMNASIGGYQAENTFGRIIEINRSVDGVYKNEYYVNTSVNGNTTKQYVVGAFGNISLDNFQTLNASVFNGAWQGAPSSNLSANADFQDVQTNLPARMGLVYMNKTNLQSNGGNIANATRPYSTALPGTSALNTILHYATSSAYGTIDPYLPDYAGISISSVINGMAINYYSPDITVPLTPGVSNSLSTAAFIPANAYTYITDVNASEWWQALHSIIENNASELQALCDRLETYGLNFSEVLDTVSNASLDAFSWTTSEFAWALVPNNNDIGNLLVFTNVTNSSENITKIGNLRDALEAAGIEEVEWNFSTDNTTLLMGWPEGVISNSQVGTRLQASGNFSSMRTAYLPTAKRGLFYADMPSPLVDIGISYYISSNSTTGRIVLRVPPYSGGGGGDGGGGGGGGGGQNSVQVIFWDALGNPIKGQIDSKGMLLQNISAKSKDGTVTINISKGTTLLTCTGKVIDEILINPATSLPNAPGYSVVKAYDFKPDCAVFNRSVTITMAYNASTLPAGTEENRLAAAFYNTSTKKWESISGAVVDTKAHTIQFSINHFTVFAILAPTPSTPTITPTITPTPTPTTGGGGLSAGAWAGIGIAIVIALVIIIYLILLKIYPPAKREQ